MPVVYLLGRGGAVNPTGTRQYRLAGGGVWNDTSGGAVPPALTIRKALYMNGQGYRMESATAPAKPLVLLNGRVKERTGSEGIILTLENGRLRTLRSDETI